MNRYPRKFYKKMEREFHKKRWPLLDFKSMKISGMHCALHHSAHRGWLAMAGWDGKKGNGTMHIFDTSCRHMVQIRKIENGYITETVRWNSLKDFDSVWWHKN